MQLFAGTSGFSYKEWRGTFYEERLPEAQMLSAYAARLPTVEINNSFYRMPKASMLEGWRDKVPQGFTFALKAPRSITHISKLKHVTDSLAHLCETARVLGSKLGPMLFQLPPTLRKDSALLADFCEAVPKDLRAAIEFRHGSWFEDEIYALLSKAGIALCAAEVDADEGSGAPFVRTAPFTYVRLRRAQYDAAGLASALTRIEALGVERAFVYMKHEVLGPSYALDLLTSFASRS